MKRPLIGITAYHNKHPKLGTDYQVLYAANIVALEAAGGLPIMIPSNISKETAHAIYERLDGVLLPGGGDIDPSYYKQEAHESVRFLDESRDSMELELTRWAVADDLPVLGICRGSQVLNVALGGSLIQDVPSMVDSTLTHPYQFPDPRNKIAHPITVAAESRLAGILGETQLEVNSLHHQSVDMLAPGVVPVAYSPDGVVEAIEMPDKYFVVAVQWHPEDLVGDDPRMRQLFTGLVEAARERMA